MLNNSEWRGDGETSKTCGKRYSRNACVSEEMSLEENPVMADESYKGRVEVLRNTKLCIKVTFEICV